MNYEIEDLKEGRILAFKDSTYGIISDDELGINNRLVCIYSTGEWDDLSDIINKNFDLYESNYPMYTFMQLLLNDDIKYSLKHDGLKRIYKEKDLKIYPEYFQAILDNKKTFEIRKNDRDYKTNDILNLKEYDVGNEEYTGREQKVKVTYILDDSSTYLQPNYICMGIEKIESNLNDMIENTKLLTVEFEDIKTKDRFLKQFKNWEECHKWHHVHWTEVVIHGEIK